MAIELELKPGQTPLDPDEVAGLKPRHIATQGELDEWEAQNIVKASRWIARQRKLDVLNDHFRRELHAKMFDDTWKWAGTFRKSDKNIGCDWTQIAVNLRQLLDNMAYWLEHNVFPPEEVAVRFHHRLVWLHAFPNGNGRHARLMTDCLLRQCGLAPFSWGRGNLVTATEVRQRYIQALRAADANDYALLLAFVRS
ncbi:mobile mystery protein B [Pseudomonas cedrina]|uniref:Cell filamentation protein Fic n=2 Tax=Pseudomonas cedrina TaxID=651740 RepID=A0A1V2KA16_PSECE|nr:mobile mystery protein B [Pseudomonas cedrina]ONH53906.1 cell filamentation protein Fic [Pseudomonas cedrina subsp. cedrina]SDT56627.1 mobile mystery protein B [Pseudomonas cedrina]